MSINVNFFQKKRQIQAELTFKKNIGNIQMIQNLFYKISGFFALLIVASANRICLVSGTPQINESYDYCLSQSKARSYVTY